MALGLELQAGEVRSSFTSETAKRITQLKKKFNLLLEKGPEEQRLLASKTGFWPDEREKLERIRADRNADLDRNAEQIHAEVDRYVAEVDGVKLKTRLIQILGSTELAPLTFESQQADTKTIFVSYSFFKGDAMGEGATSFTIRAYQRKAGRMKLVGATGTDLDGYVGISVSQLNSPWSHEAWFLAYGYMSGANGPNARMRVYLFHEGRFYPKWMPANEWALVSTRVDKSDFTVTFHEYRPDKMRGSERTKGNERRERKGQPDLSACPKRPTMLSGLTCSLI